MKHPDWYPDWRHDAVHQLQDKIDRLKSEFRLNDWPRYDYDIDAGTLTFSENGVPKLIAEIQVAGTTSVKAGDWLWAWANSHWPEDRVTDSEIVRAFGQEHGICELTHENVEDDDLNALGWALTAVMVRLTDALGAYRPRDDDGGLFLVYKSMAWAG
ncbi:DUF6882 domain-containing protein [Phenylobacterium montanum]|uniref:Uncharacterized protein n=1 Tax=Phenylobacterium montanum TaxID=2823693 RepID=A0A975IX66_9CAUL|nr:DUF6882 domain-containing protein [Caulobacter sp. S6]QUD90570.1 hypothetical protein KCG34_12215 [Caulobacter sp. S6]